MYKIIYDDTCVVDYFLFNSAQVFETFVEAKMHYLKLFQYVKDSIIKEFSILLKVDKEKEVFYRQVINVLNTLDFREDIELKIYDDIFLKVYEYNFLFDFGDRSIVLQIVAG